MKPDTRVCPQEELVRRSLERTLNDEEQAALAAHIEQCPSCQEIALSGGAQASALEKFRWAGDAWQKAQVDVNVPLTRLNESLTDYEVIEEIGRGGMGIVYKARQKELDRIVALKVLPALLGAVRPDAMARFRREAALAASLEHTNIIGVHDFGEIDGTLYYAMRYVEGRSLRDVLREMDETGGIDAVLGMSEVGSGKSGVGSGSERTVPRSSSFKPQASSLVPTSDIPHRTSPAATRIGQSSSADRAYFQRIATWIADVAEAVYYAHEHDIVHRDIKPSNLLLGRDGKLLISDFGLARQANGVSITATRGIIGTARYMSPEQVDQNAPPIDGRVDVYGLGATLYELLAFRPMFGGADDREILDHVFNKEPSPPSRYVRQVPRDLETVCLKALHKNRDERYASAKELADDLRRWLLNLPILAQRTPLPTRVAKFVRRRKLPVTLASACVLLLVGGAALYAAYSTAQRDADESRTTGLAHRLELLMRDAEIKRDRGLSEQALRAAEEGLQLDPDSQELLFCKVRALSRLDRCDEAIDLLDSMLQQEPDNWMAHFRMASLLRDGSRTPISREVYVQPSMRSVRLSMPSRERTQRYELHRDAVAHLQPDSAERYYLLALEDADPNRAIEHFTGAIERDPEMELAWYGRAWRFGAIGDHQSMLLDAERMVGMSPDWGVAHNLRSQALGDLGRFAEAERAADEALRCSPDVAAFWHNRSLLKIRQGRFAEALADSNRAVQLDSEFPQFYAGRAEAFVGLGQRENAMSDLRQVLRLQPDNIGAGLELGKLLVENGQIDEAHEAFSQLIVLSPNDPGAWRNRGTIHGMRREHGQSIHDFTQAIRYDPENGYAFSCRAYAHAQLGHHAEAIDDYTRSIELNPSVSGDLQKRARLLIQVGEYQRAITDLTLLLEQQVGPRELQLTRRAIAHELSGVPRLALADYANAIELDGPLVDYVRLCRFILLQIRRSPADTPAIELPEPSGVGMDPVWTRLLYEFFTDALQVDDLLAAATTKGGQCEAHYYVGVKALIEGDKNVARAAFERCIDADSSGSIEAVFARARIARLDG